jgi:plastocyanin
MLAVLAVLACFSERSPVAPPDGLADCVLPLQSVARGDAIVLIRGQQFLPDTARVRPGQAVTWVNCEAAGADPHTSTAQAGQWDSPLLHRGDFFTHPFAGTGTFAYLCLPHAHMRGAVIVE